MSAAMRQLVEDLKYNAGVAGGKKLETLLADTALWFYMNKDRIPKENIAKRCEFMETALWCSLELNALLLERIREQTGSRTLFLPSGMRHVSGAQFS